MIDFTAASPIQRLIQSRASSISGLPVSPDTQVSTSQGVPPPVDIQAELQRIIGQQAPQQQQGTAQRILGALAQGIATATSGNPGQAIQQQLQNIQTQQNLQQERADRQAAISQNFQLNDLNNRIAEERRIREERRLEAADIRKETRGLKAETEKEKRQFGYQKDLEDIRQKYALDVAKFNSQEAINLEKLRSDNNRANQRTAAFYDIAAPLAFSGVLKDDQISGIFKELDETGKVTGQNAVLLGKANKALRDEKFRQERSLRAASVGGKAEGYQAQLVRLLTNRALTESYVIGTDGKLHEAIKNGITGKLEIPGGIGIARDATAAERLAGVNDQVALLQGGIKTVGANVTGAEQDLVIKNLENLIDQDVKLGKVKAEILQSLTNFKTQNPQYAGIVDALSSKIPETKKVVKDRSIEEIRKENKERGGKRISDLFKSITTPSQTAPNYINK